jgi:transcription initiation factor TFIID subunit 6
LSDQSVQITSSRNEVLEDLYKKYAELIKDNPSQESVEKLRLYRELSKDAAIAPLLPYFRNYITTIPITRDRNYPQLLSDRISLIRALFKNKNISLHNELTQFIGLCITAITFNTQEPLFEYVSLREDAAELLRDIIYKFSDSYTNLRKRILDYLLITFLEKKFFPSKLGAAIGISIIGPELIRSLLIPKMPEVLNSCYERAQRETDARIQYLKFKAIIMRICGDCFNADTLEALEKTGSTALPEDVAKMYNDLIPFFGTEFFMYAAK